VRHFQVRQLVAPGQVEARDTLPSFHYQPTAAESSAHRLPWSREDPTFAVGFLARDEGVKAPGRLIASAVGDGKFELRRLPDCSIVKTIPVDSQGPITVLQFSKDGGLLFVGSNPARIYDVDEQKLLPLQMKLPSPVRRAAFLPEKNQLICSGHVINSIKFYQYRDTYLFSTEGEGVRDDEDGEGYGDLLHWSPLASRRLRARQP